MGKPELAQPLHLTRPFCADRNRYFSLLDDMLDANWFTNDGPLVQELERRLATYLGVRYCILTANGTLGLQLVASALGLRGEVIMPSFTFVATAHALRWQGLRPVFCDIDLDSWNLDVENCRSLITPATSAILGVHCWGIPCDTERLAAIAAEHGLRLVFDAAHAFACGRTDGLVGGFGDAEVFSFHATKSFHTGEGGAVTTNDGDLAGRLREIRNFGFTGFDRVEHLGLNAKLPESSAALGLANLDGIEATLAASQAVHEQYAAELDGVTGIELVPYPLARHNHHYVVVRMDSTVGWNRDEVMRFLHHHNVLARRYFYPGCHRMEPYRSEEPDHTGLPNTERAIQEVLVLPGGAGIMPEEVRAVTRLLRSLTPRQ